MNCKDIIKEYLKSNGYDGLYNREWSCGCGIDDLAPCGGEGIAECEPAYRCKFKELKDQYKENILFYSDQPDDANVYVVSRHMIKEKKDECLPRKKQ